MANIVLTVDAQEGTNPSITYVVEPVEGKEVDNTDMMVTQVFARLLAEYLSSTPPEELSEKFQATYKELVAERVKLIQEAEKEAADEDESS